MGGAAAHPLPQHLNLPQHSDSSPRRARYANRSHHFAVGTVVEVQTDEEDFVGVLFSATVIDPPVASNSKQRKRKRQELYVEYHNLLAREDGSERLREYVALSCVRPVPPSEPIVEPFEPGDVVDAFYKDGWWTGVVKRAVDGGERYIVTFQLPPDELEFGVSDLRVHCDWINGKWIRPPKQSKTGLMFHVGRRVEVSLDNENCQGAWFPATIHELLGNGAFVVSYFGRKDNWVQAIKVTVNYPNIRPSPPCLEYKNFVLLEKVDAYFDLCWWNGIITKELENGWYLVFFKQLKRDKEFPWSELRPHMEWKDGKWFTSSQDTPTQSVDVCIQEEYTLEKFSASAVTGPLNSVVDKKDCSDQATLSPWTKGKGHFDEISPDGQKTLHVVGARDKYTHNSSSKDIICDALSPVSAANISISATQTITRDLQSDNPSVKRTRKKQQNSDATLSVAEKVKSTPDSTNVISVQMLQFEIPYHNVGGTEPDSTGNTADIHANNETESNVVIGLPCAEMESPDHGTKGKRGRISNKKGMMNLVSDKKQKLNDPMVQKMKDNKASEVGESSERKTRGRPTKPLVEGIQTAVTGNVQNGVVGLVDLNTKYDDPNGTPEVLLIEMNSLPDQEVVSNKNILTEGHSEPKIAEPKIEKRSIRKRTLTKKMRDQKAMKESPRLERSRSTRRGRKLILGGEPQVPDELLIPDLPDVSGGKTKENNQGTEMNNAVCEEPNNGLDDEPLSKWIEGMMHPPSVIDVSRPSPVSTVDQCMENGKERGDGIVLEVESEKLPESGTDVSALADTGSVDGSDPQNLPFVKNTVLWKTIESMEVFQRIRQKPHFKPLENVKESSREGRAIGYMVTFSSVVEKTCGLQLDDPKSVADDILETLADLERHGFEVKLVRDRVVELLTVKEKQEKLMDEVKIFNNQMSEQNEERNRIEEEMKKINQDIKKLQERLSIIESAKEKKDVEIASLQMKVKESEEIMKNVGREFEGITSSPLGKI